MDDLSVSEQPYEIAEKFRDQEYPEGLYYLPESRMYYVSNCSQRNFSKGGFFQFKPHLFKDGFTDRWIVLNELLMGQIAKYLHEQKQKVTAERIRLILTCLVGACTITETCGGD